MGRVLVLIHGAGKHPENYHEPVIGRLETILGYRPEYRRCWYGDLNDVDLERGGIDDIAALRDRFRQQVRDGLARLRDDDRRTAELLGLHDLVEWQVDVASDVLRYLADEALAARVRERLEQTLDIAAGLGEIVLVSHSLGSVVAYDVLRRRAADYHISHFVTCGCPLLKVVFSGARPAALGAINEATVPFWRNLYDLRDPVANFLGPAFPGFPVQDVLVPAVPGVDDHDYWSRAYVLRMIGSWLSP